MKTTEVTDLNQSTKNANLTKSFPEFPYSLPEIFEMPRPKPINSMTAPGNYRLLGRNKVVQASPAILHFDGYTLKDCHTQEVLIINISKRSRRVDILPPTTSNFKIRVNRTGLLAPGMAEHVKVDFYPSELKYHYDCIRVHAEDENLLIPMHAYPTANDVIFPKLVDFGICELGATAEKRIPIKCKVPVQFEYNLEVQIHHPYFTVTPLSGIIPGNGFADITIQFVPLSYETASIDILVSVSQFNFQPFVCTVTGSSMPGLSRKKELTKGAGKIGIATLAELSQNSAPILKDHTQLVSNSYKNTPETMNQTDVIDSYDARLQKAPRGTGSGAVFDAGAAWVATHRKKTHKKNILTGTNLMSPPGPPPERPETVVEGLRIPGKLNSHHAVNFVLTQVPGKLKPKDLKKAIDEQCAARATQKMEQERLKSTTSGHLNFQSILIDEENLASGNQTRQLKEMIFIQEISEEEQNAKDRQIKNSLQFIGDDLMTELEIGKILQERSRRESFVARNQRSQERSRTTLQLLGPYETPENYARVSFPACSDIKHCPNFDRFKNNHWRRRRDVLGRFVFLVGKHIIRSRASKRISKIKEFIGDAKSRLEIREKVELDNKLAKYNSSSFKAKNSKLENDGLSSFEPVKTILSKPEADFPTALSDLTIESPLEFQIFPSSVCRVRFPLFEEDAATERMEIDMEMDTKTSFNDLAHFQLRVGQESSSMGYNQISALPVSTYIPLERDRMFLTGAEEEGGIRISRDANPGWEFVGTSKPAQDENFDQKVTGGGKKRSVVASSEKHEERKDKLSVIEEEVRGLGAKLELDSSIPKKIQKQKKERKKKVSWFTPSRDCIFFVTSGEFNEKEPHSVFDNRSIPRAHRPTEGTRIGFDTGSTSLRVYNRQLSISSHWIGKVERQPSILWCLPDQHKEGLWTMKGLPPKLQKMADEDMMSDSESDDDASFELMVPTEGLALNYFKKFYQGKPVSQIVEEDKTIVALKDEVQNCIQHFSRENHFQNLEKTLVEEKLIDSERLSQELTSISERLHNLQHKFTLQKARKLHI